MSALKPCPFCGGDADVMLCQSAYGQSYRIHHEHASPCPAAYVNGLQFRTEAEAIAAWNSRVERTCSGTLDYGGWYICSNCGCQTKGNQYGEKPNYCASCGCKVVK